MATSNKYDDMVDEMQLMLEVDFVVNDFITVHQPHILDIVEYGERKYFAMVSDLCSIPSDMKSRLWDLGIDWNKCSDFQLFMMQAMNYSKEETAILFDDLDLTKFKGKVFQPDDGGEPEEILINIEDEQVITKDDYFLLVACLRKMHGFTVKREKAGNRFTRDIMIQEDRQKIEQNKNKPYQSRLKNMVSAMLVYPGFKYKKNELKECGIFEFMDSVQRARVYTSTIALMHGLQCGMRDAKGIKTDDLDWFRDA